jgi:hypothetical protein
MSSSPDSSASSLSSFLRELKSTYWMFRGLDEPETTTRQAADQWLRLADDLRRRGVHPRRYVRWAYRQFRINNATVWVNMITSPKTVARFEQEINDALEQEKLLIQLQLDTIFFQTQGRARSLRDVLEDELLDLGDAVRYAVARKAGMTDVADRWRRGAELDILNEPVYAEALSEFLSADSHGQ